MVIIDMVKNKLRLERLLSIKLYLPHSIKGIYLKFHWYLIYSVESSNKEKDNCS